MNWNKRLLYFNLFTLPCLNYLKNVVVFVVVVVVCLFVSFFTSECTVCSNSLLYCICTSKSTVTVNIFTNVFAALNRH